MALSAKVAGILDSLSQRFILRINSLTNSIKDAGPVIECSPLDELLGMLSGGIVTMDIELRGLIQSILGDLAARDAKLERTTGDLDRKQRLERFLKIISAIINALETGELCQDIRDEPGPPSASIEEIERLLVVVLLPEFEDATRGRNFIIDKYGRDPATGQKVETLTSIVDVSKNVDTIRRSLEDCGGTLDNSTLDDITRRIKERRS
jgi:hypothetical protein